MDGLKIEGKIISIGEMQTFGNDFTKKGICVETDDKYPQRFNVEFHKDRIDFTAKMKVDDPVVFLCNLNGREWENEEGKIVYFLSLVCWKIETTAPAPTAPAPPTTITDNSGLPF